ncbi:MAG TPA: A/G-specific adenine glycosylase [Anaeromyxobacteraceae bacterium]
MLVPAARRAAVRGKLLAWWDAGHRALPWRFPQDGADPYRVWLAEVMLQQTQVAVVVPYYRRFVARFPTLRALARGREEEVLALWSGLGYYARGRRLHAAAREALRRHGTLPASREALLALPGFGAYTAGAVASIAFAIPAPCVDGNVARVLSRLFLVEGAPAAKATRERLWALDAELVPRRRPGDFNQALIELGATVCGKPEPRCARCPLASLCAARRAGRERAVPPAAVRRAPTRIEVACAVIDRGGSLLLARRPPDGLFGGTWELPSTPVEVGEEPRAALERALDERLGLRVAAEDAVASVDRVLTHRMLRLTAFRCRLRASRRDARLRWIRDGELDALPLSTAMRRLLDACRSRFRTAGSARPSGGARSPGGVSTARSLRDQLLFD